MKRFAHFTPLAIVVAGLVLGALVVVFAINISSPDAGTAKPSPAAKSDDAKSKTTQHPLAREFRPDQRTVDSCTKAGSGERQGCRQQAIGNIAFRQGPGAAYRQLDALLVGADRSWVSDSHVITHSIGAATLARNKNSIGKTFAEGGSVGSMAGSAGFYHGVILTTLRGVKREDIGKRAAQVCAEKDVASVRFLKYQCLHGTGHGLMIYTGYNLPFALEACGEIGSSREVFDCKTGIFMENYSQFLGVDSGIDSNYLSGDLLYPCNWVKKPDDKLACYVQVVDRIGPGSVQPAPSSSPLGVAPGTSPAPTSAPAWDWRKIADVCRSVESPYVENCFDSYGLWADNRAGSRPSGILGICRQAGLNEGDCIYGASRAMIGNDIEGINTRQRVRDLCLLASSEHEQRCFFGVGTVLQQLGQKRHAEGCAQIAPPKYRAECLRGEGPATGA